MKHSLFKCSFEFQILILLCYKTLAVELDIKAETDEHLNIIKTFMKANGFVFFGKISQTSTEGGRGNLIFVQDFLRDLQVDEIQ